MAGNGRAGSIPASGMKQQALRGTVVRQWMLAVATIGVMTKAADLVQKFEIRLVSSNALMQTSGMLVKAGSRVGQ